MIMSLIPSDYNYYSYGLINYDKSYFKSILES